MDVGFGLGEAEPRLSRQRTHEVGVAAVVVLVAIAQQVMGIGIAARTDHVMYRATKCVKAVPVQRVLRNSGNRAEVWEAR